MQNKSKPRWWEKTVEYLFVLSMTADGDHLITPLDGTHELAGDAIFSTENTWVLIEFKKDQYHFRDEKNKFKNYEFASKFLGSKDSHHFLVYGEIGENMQLVVKGCTYFSRRPVPFATDILHCGIRIQNFKEYLKQFIGLKKPPSGPSGGGLVSSFKDYSLVAGINANNKIVVCMTLQDFINESEHDPTKNNNCKYEQEINSEDETSSETSKLRTATA